MAKLFIYGTLRRGKSAHNLIKKAPGKFIDECRTDPKYHLYDVGSFPGMIEIPHKQGQGVLGEVWEIPESGFADLDKYECVNSGLFRREEILLENGTKAFAYIFTSDMRNIREIPDGIWK